MAGLAPDTLFFSTDQTKAMKVEVIQAFLNLQAANDPNFAKIKEWLLKEQQEFITKAAFSIGVEDGLKSAFQGMALILSAIAFYATEPRLALAQIHHKTSLASTPPKPGPIP